MTDLRAKERLSELRGVLVGLASNEGDMISLMRDAIDNWQPSDEFSARGKVLTVGDGIATVCGLDNVRYGEILIFAGDVRGMVEELKRDYVCCILFGDDEPITEGSLVRRTGKTAGIPVGDGFLGRVVDALGVPVDGKGNIKARGYMPIEYPAPRIIDRQPVSVPMQTGILCIDSMFPIGRGQRELIIGDRQTGKTAIAVDTILNQKGKDVICVYVAIGQKTSSVAQICDILREHGADKYTIVVNSSASDSPSLQYIAPYAGCALAEYFMYAGRDVLIVYDDLSKHAVAYRTISLLLERSPGREAYPGDVFYLHSRLLERSARLADKLGGGSMTALPIVETQAGDVSAYIPTNIISITDGQIFLQSDLFFEGQRPAVNIGLSVSRVGGAAQTAALKKASAGLRLTLAQYKEIEVFNQFSSDLDESTARQLNRGENLLALLKQGQYEPLAQYEQVILLVAAMANIFDGVAESKIMSLKTGLLDYIREELPDICENLEKNGRLNSADRQSIIDAAGIFVEQVR
ncbi:MAG: F0F1 ATP synthase subunit alpha [Clostridia bacterium]|nr:F0F1 ATP synthase subunit alpha [Clostridia bacterium]